MNITVMVTQTWAWYHQQLDFPKSRWIKMHAVKPGTNNSYCGLENLHDEGDVSHRDFLEGDSVCKKCQKAVAKLGLDRSGEME